VIEFLESDLPVQDIGLAFIYCDHKENLSQSVDYFIRPIVRQLVERMRTIPNVVPALYHRYCGKETRPTCTEYLDLLQSLAKEYSEVYVVIDALDECVDEKGQIIWSDLLTQLGGSVPNLRLLYTSRDIDDSIGGILKRSTRIEIRATNADIEAYVQAQVESNNHLLQFCRQDSALRNKIVQAVVSKAEGM